MTRLDAETLRLVRETQLASFDNWILADAARLAWLRLFSAGVKMVLESRTEELLDSAALDRLVARLLAAETVTTALAPAIVASVSEVARRASAFEESPSSLLAEEATESVLRVIEQPEFVSEALLRAILTSPALERAVGDHLFEALDGFSSRVNPFVAAWGLPALLAAVPLIGRGTIRAALGTVQREFERRLEPETRRFIAGFVRESLDRAAREYAMRGAEPEFVRLRKEVLTAVLAVPLRELVWAPDSRVGQRALAAVEASVRSLLANPIVQREVASAFAGAFAQKRSLEGMLLEYGVVLPNPTELAETLWPTVQRCLAMPELRSELAARIDDSLASLA